MEKLSSKIYSNNALVTSNIVSLDILNTVNKIPYARVVIAEGEKAHEKIMDLSRLDCFKPGEILDIVLSVEGGSNKFKGVVVKHKVRKNSKGAFLSIDIKHPAYKLTGVRSSAVFKNQDDLTIMDSITGPFGIKVECDSKTIKHEQLVQYYCTPWDFLLSRAEANGLIVCADFDKDSPVLFLKKPAFGDTGKTLDSILEYELEADLSEPYKQVNSVCWDIKEVELLKRTSGDGEKLEGELFNNVKEKGIENITQVSGVHSKAEEVKSWADAALLKRQHSLLRGRVTIKGNSGIKLGDTVNIAGEGTVFYGNAIVSGIRHRINSEGWVTDIQCGLDKNWFYKNDDIIEKPASGLVPGVNGLQIGIVEAFPSDGDSEKIHRIKIRIPAVDATDSVIWARLLFPYAGKDRGLFFVPEEGDEVVIGFFNDDPRHAVVLGALYNGKATPPLEFTDKNNEKGIITRNNIKMVFTDEDDKEKIEISTPGGNTILIEDEKGISLEDSNGNKTAYTENGVELEDKNGNKVITDDGGMEVEDLNGNIFSLSSQGIKIEDANGNSITLDSAGIKLTDTGGSNLVLEAAGATLESPAKVAVKGAAVDIN